MMSTLVRELSAAIEPSSEHGAAQLLGVRTASYVQAG